MEVASRHIRCNDLRRVKLELPGGASLRLHHWRAGDPEHLQHRHPWAFLTVVLRGGYRDAGEGRPDDLVRAPAARWRGRDWQHSVTDVVPGTVSVVVTMPQRGPWRYFISGREVGELEWDRREC